MFTKNWYKVLAMVSSPEAETSYTVTTTDSQTASPTLAEAKIAYNDKEAVLNPNLAKLAVPEGTNGGVIFGASNTPAKIADENIAGENLNAKLQIVQSKTTDLTEEHSAVTVTYIVSNPGTEPVTINEIGLFGSKDSKNYLVDRTVLGSPITIAAGDAAKVAYTLQMDYPVDAIPGA